MLDRCQVTQVRKYIVAARSKKPLRIYRTATNPTKVPPSLFHTPPSSPNLPCLPRLLACRLSVGQGHLGKRASRTETVPKASPSKLTKGIPPTNEHVHDSAWHKWTSPRLLPRSRVHYKSSARSSNVFHTSAEVSGSNMFQTGQALRVLRRGRL